MGIFTRVKVLPNRVAALSNSIRSPPVHRWLLGKPFPAKGRKLFGINLSLKDASFSSSFSSSTSTLSGINFVTKVNTNVSFYERKLPFSVFILMYKCDYKVLLHVHNNSECMTVNFLVFQTVFLAFDKEVVLFKISTVLIYTKWANVPQSLGPEKIRIVNIERDYSKPPNGMGKAIQTRTEGAMSEREGTTNLSHFLFPKRVKNNVIYHVKLLVLTMDILRLLLFDSHRHTKACLVVKKSTKYKKRSKLVKKNGHILSLFVLLILCLSSKCCNAFHLASCSSALGMESGDIKDDQITASSSYDVSVTGPSLARLNIDLLEGAWCPRGMVGNGDFHYLEVTLKSLHMISGVVTQGRFGNGRGMEYVENFLLEYWREGFKEWRTYKLYNGSKILRGNRNTYTPVKRILMPPILASKLRFVPYSTYPRTVCMRTEIIGCPYGEGVLSYSAPQGQERGLEVELVDASYDGVIGDQILSGGVGQLSDGVTGEHNFRANLSRGKGYEWVGWKNDTGDPLELVFQFDGMRNFSMMYIYTNNMFSKGVQVFSRARVWFSLDGRSYNPHVIEYNYMTDTVSEYARNVSIVLRERLGRFIKAQLFFSSRWIMISEVFFISFPFRGNLSGIGESQASLPSGIMNSDLRDRHAGGEKSNGSRGYIHDGTQIRNSDINKVTEVSTEEQRQKYVALIIGILVAVILVLMGAIIFIFWRTKKQKMSCLSHDLLPGPFGEKRDIVSLKEVQKFLTAPGVLRSSFLCPSSSSLSKNPSAGSSRTLPQAINAQQWQVGVDLRDGISKNGLYVEPLPVSYGTSKRRYNAATLPLSSPDYTDCTSTEYAVPQEFGGGLDSSYKSPFTYSWKQSQGQFSSFLGKSTPTPTPSVCSSLQPSQSKAKLKGSVYSCSLGAEFPQQENFYATTEIVKPSVNGAQILEESPPFPDASLIGGDAYPPEVPRHRITFLEQIGEGDFGKVHVGQVEDDDGRKSFVAVKSLSLEASVSVRVHGIDGNGRSLEDSHSREGFEREVEILGRLRDQNIVRVVGVCTNEEPLCMLVEYCEDGDLNQYLQVHVAETSDLKAINAKMISYGCLIYMATQIASGMKYLESLSFVHRDLATRNCLVGAHHMIKICDFGMSRQMYSSDYYRTEKMICLPIRWMAWESILLGKFTTKSDVWAFAVTLWEVLTMAREHPYEEYTDEQVIENVSLIYYNDQRKVYLPQPPNCPKEIYDLMKECWKKSDVDRPTFKEIHMFLQRKNLGYAPSL